MPSLVCYPRRFAVQVPRLRPHQGFSFSGEVREPFPAVIQAMEETSIPVTSVDAPSSWNIEDGPPKSGVGSSFNPDVLVSLTAPKPLVKFFNGRHFIGGRYVQYLASQSSLRANSARLLTSPSGSSPQQSRKNMSSTSQTMKGSIRLSRSGPTGRNCNTEKAWSPSSFASSLDLRHLAYGFRAFGFDALAVHQLHHSATAVPTVRADWTWTTSL